MFSNSTFTKEQTDSSSLRERFAALMRHLSLTVLALTIAGTPWFLGGAIPHARFLLLSGTITASALALLASVLVARRSLSFPNLTLPLIGMAGLGVLQLQPIFPHPATQMNHAVMADAAKFLPHNLRLPTHPRSASPAETRRCVSQLVALALIVFVVQDAIRSTSQIAFLMTGLTLSGIAMASLSLSQQFGNSSTVVGNHWKISNSIPFGCFVNPNNAAGWLTLCLSSGLFLCGFVSKSDQGRPNSIRSTSAWATVTDRLWNAWIDFIGKVSSMSAPQILALCGLILLMAAITATLSRAGITAVCLGLISFAGCRLKTGHWLTTLLVLVLIVVLTCSFLVLFELDTLVLAELQTLKDPVSESTGRILHWTDSLSVFRDFPVLGTGLGAYRFATLPYQRHYTGKWFQRADNQYVETLIESGLLGCFCIIACGVMIAMMVFRAIKADRRNRNPKLHSIQKWLAGVVACAFAGIASASFFDYGISLPSVSSAFIAIASCLLAMDGFALQGNALKDPVETQKTAEIPRSLFARMSVWLGLTIVGSVMLPDSYASVLAYGPVPEAQRQIHRPEMSELLKSGDDLLSELREFATKHSDDPEYQRLHVLFCKLLYERNLVEHIVRSHPQMNSSEHKDNLLRIVNPTMLLAQLHAPDTPMQVKRQAVNDIRLHLQTSNWLKAGKLALNAHPLLLSLAYDMSAYGLLLEDEQSINRYLAISTFIEPHASPNQLALGSALIKSNRQPEGKKLWETSLMASDTTRASILLELAKLEGIEPAIREFGPSSWDSAARSGLLCGANPELQTALLDIAEEFWPQIDQPKSRASVDLRVSQLQSMNRNAEAIQFVENLLARDFNNIGLRESKARLLEKSGMHEKAYDEWLRIESLWGKTDESDKALDRLIRLPPTMPR